MKKKPTKEEVQYYLNLSEEDLFAEIGNQIDPSLEAFPQSIQEISRKGKLYFKQKSQELQKDICEHEMTKLTLDNSVQLNVVLNLFDVVESATTGIPVLPFTVALCQFGVSKYCSNYWDGL